jgi:dipeptidyl aminopeptidase/acylaminoacyl peptidase
MDSAIESVRNHYPTRAFTFASDLLVCANRLELLRHDIHRALHADPCRESRGYAATDLISAASRIQARPLLIHGLADQNVHVENSLDFIEALLVADKPFDFIAVPNMGHTFTGDGLLCPRAPITSSSI